MSEPIVGDQTPTTLSDETGSTTIVENPNLQKRYLSAVQRSRSKKKEDLTLADMILLRSQEQRLTCRLSEGIEIKFRPPSSAEIAHFNSLVINGNEKEVAEFLADITDDPSLNVEFFENGYLSVPDATKLFSAISGREFVKESVSGFRTG